jgi:hypothetical protein
MKMAKVLFYIAKSFAAIFISLAVVLAAVPFILFCVFDGVASNLSGEWRRGRDQNRVWRWARDHRAK